MMKSFKVSEKSLEKNNRELRNEGITPAVIYGSSIPKATSVQIDSKVLLTMFKEKSMGSIIPLELNSSKINCVIKEIQKNNFGKTIHIDFQAVSEHDSIKLHIPVVFVGHEAIGNKGLIFEAILSELEFHGHPQDIPETVEIDASHLELGDRILASDVKLPKGVTITVEPETLLALVKEAKHYEEEEESTISTESVEAVKTETESAE